MMNKEYTDSFNRNLSQILDSISERLHEEMTIRKELEISDWPYKDKLQQSNYNVWLATHYGEAQ